MYGVSIHKERYTKIKRIIIQYADNLYAKHYNYMILYYIFQKERCVLKIETQFCKY